MFDPKVCCAVLLQSSSLHAQQLLRWGMLSKPVWSTALHACVYQATMLYVTSMTNAVLLYISACTPVDPAASTDSLDLGHTALAKPYMC